MKEIIQKENSILRETASDIPVEEIKTEKTRKLIADMKEALHAAQDGVAIAAPQIGVPLRVFVVSGKIFHEKGESENEKEEQNDFIFINPVIKKISRKKVPMEEGCLSVRNMYGTMLRSEKATIEAFDENGEKTTIGASGFLAQIFQHEIDHLNGILFTDSAENLRESELRRPARESSRE